MPITEVLQSVQFIIGSDGKPTGAILPIEIWEKFIAWLEDMEDTQTVREGLARLQVANGNLQVAGLVPWSQVELGQKKTTRKF
jgi:hypothetical protein